MPGCTALRRQLTHSALRFHSSAARAPSWATREGARALDLSYYLPDSVAVQIADIFAGDVDFHRELRQGDRFALVFEQYYLDGRPVHAGRVLAAEFTSRGRTYRALHYSLAQGDSGHAWMTKFSRHGTA